MYVDMSSVEDPSASDEWEWQRLFLVLVGVVYAEVINHSFLLQDD